MYIQLDNGKYKAQMQKLTFGAGPFSEYDKREEYFRLLDIYYNEFGGRSIDTARLYGNGISEKILGEWMISRSVPREDIFITTKGAHPPVYDRHIPRLDPESIKSDLAASLEASKLDYVDLYLLHRDCIDLPVDGIMDTLHSFVESGKVRFIGVSNWSVDRIEEANKYARKNGLTPLSASQICFSLAVSTPELHNDDTLVCMTQEEAKWYEENQFPVMAFSSQAKGLFSKYIEQNTVTPKIKERFLTEQNLRRLERVREISGKKSISPAAVALAYLTCNPIPTSAVFSCRTEEQLRDTMSAKNVVLDKDTVSYLACD